MKVFDFLLWRLDGAKWMYAHGRVERQNPRNAVHPEIYAYFKINFIFKYIDYKELL